MHFNTKLTVYRGYIYYIKSEYMTIESTFQLSVLSQSSYIYPL